MTNDEKAEFIAVELLGFPVCRSCEEIGNASTEHGFCVSTIYGDTKLMQGCGGEWNPYESADDDLMVRRAMVRRCSSDPKSLAIYVKAVSGTRQHRIRGDAFAESCVDRGAWPFAHELFGEPGDYTDAAYAVLKGESDG